MHVRAMGVGICSWLVLLARNGGDGRVDVVSGGNAVGACSEHVCEEI